MKQKLKVLESAIHGKGLFAHKKISAGTILGTCETEPTDEISDYTLWIGDDETVDVVCPLKYINHSKSPNVAYYDDLTVVALKDISKGEELTHDYGSEWE